MITIESGRDEIKPRGVRKATLTKRAVLELRLKIDCALLEEMRRRLGRSAVDFLIDIRKKSQRQWSDFRKSSGTPRTKF